MHVHPPSYKTSTRLSQLIRESRNKQLMPATINVNRRVMTELQELALAASSETALPGIIIHSESSNIMKLCAHMTPQEGIYAGLPLHATVTLPTGYPQTSPNVVLDTLIRHPNVFPGWICCDILKGKLFRDDQGRVSGYSPAYSLSAVLMQLLSFFSAKRIDQDYGETYEVTFDESEARRDAICHISEYHCKQCGFNGTEKLKRAKEAVPRAPVSSNRFIPGLNRVSVKPSKAAIKNKKRNEKKRCFGQEPSALFVDADSLDSMSEIGSSSASVEQGKEANETERLLSLVPEGKSLSVLPEDVLLEMTRYIPSEDLIRLSKVSNVFEGLMDRHNLLVKRDIKCFFHKTSPKDAILGVGLWVADKGKNRDMKPVDFDILSHEAFTSANITKTIFGQEFNYFLPLALTPHHFAKSLPLLQKTLMQLNFSASAEFDPFIGLKALSKLMNLMVVDLVQVVDEEARLQDLEAEARRQASLVQEPIRLPADAICAYCGYACGNPYGRPSQPPKKQTSGAPAPPKSKMIASEKALIGYSQLLHLLLSLCAEYPELKDYAEKQLEKFVTNKGARDKIRVPNMGEFIILLFCQSKYSWFDLAVPVFRECSIRSVVWMLDCQNGNKPHLALLEKAPVSDFRLAETFKAQRTSLRLLMFQVLFMRRMGLGERPTSELLAGLNNRYGYPKATLAEVIIKDVKEIMQVSAFNDFLARVEIPVPTKKYFCGLLKTAIVHSARRVYHKSPYTWSQLWYLRLKEEPDFAEAFGPDVTPRYAVEGGSFFPGR
ncbi:hypothetical protein BC830DRAFT_1091706 [Chytriomyces sp. MP71]|nr:hypothetical protein BC830DRAFT_1091706 [Chytriomyces sp. MP71]